MTSRAKVDQSSLDALVGGNDVRCDLDHREARLDHLPCDQLDSLVACDATDPVFAPGEERSAKDVPKTCPPTRTPTRSRRRPSTAEERHCEERLGLQGAGLFPRPCLTGNGIFSFLDGSS